ncbi:hypothetical protein HZB02_06350 [Candidatus Woesearchaeota archaeon]|nr:hypothetical protein [Candidatus Woesearchaeota archaeon]
MAKSKKKIVSKKPVHHVAVPVQSKPSCPTSCPYCGSLNVICRESDNAPVCRDCGMIFAEIAPVIALEPSTPDIEIKVKAPIPVSPKHVKPKAVLKKAAKKVKHAQKKAQKRSPKPKAKPKFVKKIVPKKKLAKIKNLKSKVKAKKSGKKKKR